MSNYKMLGAVPLQEIIDLLKKQCPENLQPTLAKLEAGERGLKMAESRLLANYEPPAPPKPDDSMQRNEEYNRRVLEDAAKVVKERDAAIRRLNAWEQAGLLPNDENRAAINKALVELPALAEWRSKGSVLTEGIIDVVVSHLGPKGTNVLQWKPKEVAPAPTAPVEKVTLSDGTEQLPLGIPPSYKHSKVQLADLARREAQVKSRNRHGWHGGGRI